MFVIFFFKYLFLFLKSGIIKGRCLIQAQEEKIYIYIYMYIHILSFNFIKSEFTWYIIFWVLFSVLTASNSERESYSLPLKKYCIINVRFKLA